MVVFYNESGEIKQAEHNVMTPTFPANMTIKEQIEHYKEEGLCFICLNYEIGGAIFNYKVIVDLENNFVALQPI